MAGSSEIVRTGGTDGSIYGSPVRMFDAVLRVFGLRFECCIPAIVENYDRNSHMVLARPLVNMVSADGEQLKRDVIEVPARRIQHGEFLIDIPIYKGDTGWIIAGDRDNENAMLSNCFDTTSEGSQNRGGQRPITKNIHKYRFGFFLPDRWGEIKLDKIGDVEDSSLVDETDHTGDAVIRSMNGKTCIVISKDGDIEISLNKNGGNNSLTLNANLNVNGNISSSGDVSVGGSGSFAGSISTDMSISASGDVFADGKVGSAEEVYVNKEDNVSINLSDHKHSFPHKHTTPMGDTGTADPEETDIPLDEYSGQHEVTATINLTVGGTVGGNSANLFNVIYDRLASGNGTSATTGTVSGTNSFKIGPLKIVEKDGDSYTNKPYIRIGFAVKSSTSSQAYKTTRGTTSVTSSYGTVTETTPGGTDTYTVRKYLTIDVSQYLTRDYSEQRNIEININHIVGNSSTASISNVNYIINGHTLIKSISVS